MSNNCVNNKVVCADMESTVNAPSSCSEEDDIDLLRRRQSMPLLLLPSIYETQLLRRRSSLSLVVEEGISSLQVSEEASTSVNIASGTTATEKTEESKRNRRHSNRRLSDKSPTRFPPKDLSYSKSSDKSSKLAHSPGLDSYTVRDRSPRLQVSNRRASPTRDMSPPKLKLNHAVGNKVMKNLQVNNLTKSTTRTRGRSKSVDYGHLSGGKHTQQREEMRTNLTLKFKRRLEEMERGFPVSTLQRIHKLRNLYHKTDSNAGCNLSGDEL